MKRKLTLLAAIPMLLMGFSSCSHDDDPIVPADGQEIRVATRATAYDGNDDGFTEGQVMTIGIRPKGVSAEEASFYKYTYQNGEWVSDNPMKVSNFEGLNKIYMYIGYTDVNYYEKSVYLHYTDYLTDIDNLISDQSEGLLNFDWMIPTGEVALPTAENPVINAHFIHGLAKVTIGNITFGSEYDETPEITDVRFKGFESSGYNSDFDIVENVFAGLGFYHGIVDVIPFEDTTNGTYTAMLATNREMNLTNEVIIPTEWTLLTLKVNGEEKTVKLVDNPDTTDVNEALLEAGKHYTFNLKVGKDIVTLIPTTTDTNFPGGWNNDSEVDLK